MLKFISFVVVIVLFFSLFSCNSHADEAVEINSKFNPFELVKDRVVPGNIVQIKIVDKDSFESSSGVKIEDINKIELDYEGDLKEIKNYYFKNIDNDLFLVLEMPLRKTITSIKNISAWGGWFTTYKAQLRIIYKKTNVDGEPEVFRQNLPVEIPNFHWAYTWGIIAILISFLIAWALKPDPLKKQEGFDADNSKDEWQKTNGVKRFFLYPLHFTITPLGTYSISLAKILFWTFITIFGFVYVYRLSGKVLDITPQMLTLLGIGGGTALAAKINAQSRVREIPQKYLGLVKKTRIPRLKDLLSIGGQPNIFKFQMIVFTLFTGYYVIVEIIKTCAFPEIPGNLMTMMGMSSIIYLGNEVASKNVWEEIKKKVEAIKEYAEKNNEPINNAQEINDLDFSEVGELKTMLNEIYS